MKNVALSSLLTIALAIVATAGLQGQTEERLGLPGDNLNLYGVMKLFQESPTLEEFERKLNDPNTMLNNLDLNGDYQVDYINVIDFVDGNVHNIVLRDALNKTDYQDVAVITVQPGRNGDVFVQMIGDEALYGKDYIIEPYYDNGTPNPGYNGNSRVYYGQNVTVHRTTTVEVSAWPIVRFIFAPSYVVWRSPWYFGYYPVYWNPWRPYYWDFYIGYHRHWDDYYFGYYHRWNTYRYNRYNDFYFRDHRSYSNTVEHRIADNYYRNTYSRPDLRDKGSEMFRETHPQGVGHHDNGNHNGNYNNQGKNNQNNGNHYGNVQQGQGRASTSTSASNRTPQHNANQTGRIDPRDLAREGQMAPGQNQNSNSNPVNTGRTNTQQNVSRNQNAPGHTGTMPSNSSNNAQQTSRPGNNNSYSRPIDKSGDRPTSVPGAPRSSVGNGQNRSSSGTNTMHNQGAKRQETVSRAPAQKSTKENKDGRRR